MSGWGELAEDIAVVARLVAHESRHATVRAALDQDAAAIRDRLDELGVTVADPEAIRAGLAFMHLLAERVHEHAWIIGAVGADTLVRATRNGIVAAVLDHVPQEAQR